MMRLRPRRWLRAEAGAAATEFVLIAPILVVFFFGIFHVGLAIYRTQVIEASAREGARVASVGAPAADVEAAAWSAAPGFAPSELEVDTNDLCSGSGDDTTVTVTADGATSPRLDFSIPFVGSWSPTYTATAVFRCERTTGTT